VVAVARARARAAPEAQDEKDGNGDDERHDSGVHGVNTWLCLVVWSPVPGLLLVLIHLPPSPFTVTQ
jgi:hypothetical protein